MSRSSSFEPSEIGRRRKVFLIAGVILLAVMVGAVLRVYRLEEQILLGDELHAVRAVISLDLMEIATTYRTSDHSIPLSSLFEARVESGAALRPGFMRLPGLVSGVLLLIVPVAIGRILGWDRGVIAAWLLALSPGLVLYSRIVRPYMPATLFATLAIFTFYAWWRSHRPGWGVGYVTAAALAFWFSPVMAPFLGAPLLFAVARKAWDFDRGPSLRQLFLVGGGFGLVIAAVLAPAWESFFDLLEGKLRAGRPGWDSVGPVIELQAGSGHAAVALGVWLTALTGLVLLSRRRPDLALLTATAVSAQWLVLWLTVPLGLPNPLVWNRYLLATVPLLLLWVAEALARVASGRWSGALRGSGPSMVAILILVWFTTGPLAQPRVRWSSFLHGHDFLGFYREPGTPSKAALSPYRWVAATGGGVVEVLGVPSWYPHSHVAAYQRFHRQPVILAPSEPGLFVPEVELSHYVRPVPRAVLQTPARWMVLHLDPVGEFRALAYPGRGLFRGGGRLTPVPKERLLRKVARFRSVWGPPDVAGPVSLLWDLDRVRAAGSFSRPEG